MTLNIAYTINKKYIKYLFVSLMSLLSSNADNEIIIYILSNNLSESDISHIRKFINSYNQKCEFYDIEDLDVFSQYLHSGYSVEVFLRLYLPWTLRHVDKVLYIDADTLICGNLKKYFEIGMYNMALAGCQDSSRMQDTVKMRNNIFERDGDYSYYNAGVMLWNLEYIRNTLTMNDFLKVITIFGNRLYFNDQDILNYIFYEKIVEIADDSFNFIVENHRDDDLFSESVIKSDILHFAGLNPWKYGKRDRIDFRLWWGTAEKTPLYDQIVDETLKNVSITIENTLYEEKVYKDYTEYKLKGRKLSESVVFFNCNSIVLYGAGAWGRLLIEELMDIKSKIKYVFGKNVGDNIGGFVVKNFEDYCDNINENDLLIITPIKEYEEIYDVIKGKVNARIIKLVDVWDR